MHSSGNATVGVVGAGTAGCAAATVLARAGVSTVLIERFEEAGWKVGESLPPAAKALLEGLGLWDRFLGDGHTESYGNRSAWGSPEVAERDFIFDPSGNGWHLDRRRFDRMLRTAAVEAGTLWRCPARILTIRPHRQPGWHLEVRSEGRASSFRCDFVIDATGRAAWFSRSRSARRDTYDRMVAIAGLLPATRREAECDCRILVEAVEHGWWYSAHVPDGSLVLAYMTDADLVPALGRSPAGWWSLLSSTVHTRARAEGFRPPTVAPRVVSANSSYLTSPAGESWVAIGDAAAAHDPLSSQGICSALATGQAAAGAVLAWLNGQHDALTRYAQNVVRAYHEYLAERASYYALERRWLDSPFWQRRARGEHQRPATPWREEPLLGRRRTSNDNDALAAERL